ncbi:DNA metabolism protein [Rahnella variigena]|nr:DNA metabolism protein [Rahnella variigena]
MGLGSARSPHGLCVHSGSCALSAPSLASLATPHPE